jgi:AcrR family transcriptional regulator
MTTNAAVTTKAQPKRRYDNTLRRERASQTRDRIVAAGAELVRESSIRDWHAVTLRAVAARAAVNERTVYRHFANERALRDAVMQQLEAAVGIDLTNLRLGDIATAAARILRHVATYPSEVPEPLDPTLAEANRRQHEALLAAVQQHTGDWCGADRAVAAAMLDVLWSLSSYERLVRDWNFDADDAIRGVTWVIGLVEQAIRDGQGPARADPGSAR